MSILKSPFLKKYVLIAFNLLTISSIYAEVPAFDSDKPATSFTTSYSQVFNTSWDGTTFFNQWDMIEPTIPFGATDITSGYLQFTWSDKRVLRSKSTYSTPYVFSTVLDWSAGPTTNGGIIVRSKPNGYMDALQESGNDWAKFNRTGIAFYPTTDGQNMTVQFSATDNGAGTTAQTRIDVPKPAGVTSLLNDKGTIRIEDFGTTLYVYYNGARYIRIDLGGLSGGIYTSGTVYNSDMTSVGTFTSMEVESAGKVGIAQRVSNIRLYRAEILTTPTASISMDSDKPVATYPNTYNQVFNSWDATAFNAKWDMMEPTIPFTASDVTGGYLQFKWSEKRVIRSKKSFYPPYIFQTDLDWSAAGTTDGGIVIRSSSKSDLDVLQEPGDRVVGFNREGIAFYPSMDGQNMIVQFSAIDGGYGKTAQTRINVPKLATVASMKGRGVFRIEDFDTSIYVYYNDLPFARINLGGKTENIYTSGTVYDATMQVMGNFTGMKVEAIGNLAIAQRNSNIRLYSVTQRYNGLNDQAITFNSIGIKQSDDGSFALSASSTSGLPIEFSVVSGPATISGNTVTLTGPGLVKIAANQPGNASFYPAPEITRSFFVENSTASKETVQLKAYGDSWVATDGIGRILPEYSDCGEYRNKKYVGMFYLLWHADIPNGTTIKTFPELMIENPESPAFEYGRNYYWGEPEDGFYHPSDPWSTRRNLQMLANAGVDFLYFDFTNGAFGQGSVESFMNVALDMYNKGIPVPKISIFLAWNYAASMPVIMDKIYSRPEYDPILFKWEGKPLLLGDTTACATQWPQINDKGIKDHFTWRKMWAFDGNASPWHFMDRYPQTYNSVGGVPEQMPVSKAFGAPLLNGNIGQGASFHKGKAPVYNQYWETDQTKYGYQFEEQWSRAHQVDPSIVCVTGWNELAAGAWISDAQNSVQCFGKTWDDPSWRCVNQATCPSKDANGNHIAHGWHVVDEFNKEFNRDICPMKDDITDNYYYQLVSHIRKYKGMSAPEPISASKTVSIDGNFDEWLNVTPAYKDAVGDVTNRNFKNVIGSAMLTNTTARNDISESRATFDANNIYFYVKTVQNLTPSTDPNWMLLFIDADRNKGTGWEGYDYVVNLGVSSASQTTLKQWTGSAWGNAVDISYSVVGNEMELSVPRTVVMMDKSTPEFYFHWSDNAQQLDSINCFFTDGESAPDRRFNYNYSTSKITVIEQSAYKTLNIPGTIEFEDFDNGGAGVAYADATLGNQGGAYRPAESVDIETKTGGGYSIGRINANEWLEYTVDVKAIGKFTASINYAAIGEGKEAILYVDDTDKSGIISFPSTGNLDTWSNKTVDLQLKAGKHILKLFVKNAANDFKLDNIVFTEKEVIYPGSGTGLNKTLWKGVAPRTWFKDSICSEIDPAIDKEWADVSPGCGIAKDFWNVRWTGQIESLFTELYTFYLTVNDMGRVWINNQLLIDAWLASSSGKTFTATMALTAGQKVPIKVDFAEMGGDAKVMLEWSSASNPREVVPQYQLYPTTNINGISDVKKLNFNVYPNPATNNLTITSGANNVETIKIIDLQGRIVYSNKEQFSGAKALNISLDKGIYFVKLTGDIPFAAQKLIIEK